MADLGVRAGVLVTHILTGYSELLPGNPRLIIRVASAWAMLRAVGRSLNLDVNDPVAEELLVRAAIMWVRFPVLVDRILDAHTVIVLDPDDKRCPPAWRRPDVQQVITMHDGRRADLEDLAAYFGRFFAPQPPERSPEPKTHRPAADPH